MKNLTIVYHYFAHYREPVLRQLVKDLPPDWSLKLISDDVADVPSLNTVRMQDLCDTRCSWIRVTNKLLGRWLWQKGLLTEIFNTRSEILIFLGQINFITTWLAVLLAKSQGKKCFFWTHGVYGNEGRIKMAARNAFYRLSDGLFLYGARAKNILRTQGIPEHRMHIVYNSLDYELQRRLRSQKQLGMEIQVKSRHFGAEYSTTPLVVFVGRLTPVKRLDILIHAIANLAKKSFPIKCLIIGDGPQRNEIQQLVNSLNLDEDIKLLGSCHDETSLSDLIYAADVCVSPGNVGLTAMHALAYGTPVITHDKAEWQMPEFEAISPGISGNFFKKDDASDLSSKLANWLTTRGKHRESVREACFDIIDRLYNPVIQSRIIYSVVKNSRDEV